MPANKRMPEGEPIKSDIMPEGDEEEFEDGEYVPYYEVTIKRQIAYPFYSTEKIYVEGYLYKRFATDTLPKILDEDRDRITSVEINQYKRWVVKR